MTEPKVPARIEECLRRWNRQINMLRGIRVLLGIVGLASSVVIAWAASDLSPNVIRGLALIAGATTALVGLSDLRGKANSMRDAWSTLETERLRFLYAGGTIGELIDKYEAAEGRVGPVHFRSRDRLGGPEDE